MIWPAWNNSLTGQVFGRLLSPSGFNLLSRECSPWGFAAIMVPPTARCPPSIPAPSGCSFAQSWPHAELWSSPNTLKWLQPFCQVELAIGTHCQLCAAVLFGSLSCSTKGMEIFSSWQPSPLCGQTHCYSVINPPFFIREKSFRLCCSMHSSGTSPTPLTLAATYGPARGLGGHLWHTWIP